MGIFARCKPHTKDLAWNIVVYLSTVSHDITKLELESSLKKSISYNLLNKLVEKEIVTKIDWSWKKMLIDDVSERPAYWKWSIDEMKSINYKNLVSHASKSPEIRDIIEEVFAQYWITNIDPLSRDFIKIYNTIIDIMTDRKLYGIRYWYGRLEWRPQSANKYNLSVEHRQEFEKQQLWSLQKAMESIKKIK